MKHKEQASGEAAENQVAKSAKDPAKASRSRTALASIDRQVPGLTYLGLGCWIAWNTIGFSGAFWLHDTDTSVRSENLMMVHLATCVVTLLLFALFSKRASKVVAKNAFTYAGALIACLGTLLIVVTREAILPNQYLFYAGCILSGAGTTALFMRAAALFGTLAPHRALYTIAMSELFSIMVFFVLNGCPNEVASICFVLLPLLSAFFFSLRSRNVRGETQVLANEVPIPRKFGVLLLSIGLCSTALELIRSYILIGMPPTVSVSSTAIAQFVEIFVMAAVALVVLLARGSRDDFGKLYSIAAGGLTLLIIVVSMFSLRSTPVASMGWIICSCYNMVVWSMLYYLIYQWKANAVRTMALGNAALSGGTLAASALAMAYQSSQLGEDFMRVVITVIGIAVLVDVLFVFSEKQINSLLLPIDEATDAADDAEEAVHESGQWNKKCAAVAARCQLSTREAQVMAALSRGRSAQEIADREVLSIYTVRAHTRSIYAKLDVHSKKELVEFIRKEEVS